MKGLRLTASKLDVCLGWEWHEDNQKKVKCKKKWYGREGSVEQNQERDVEQEGLFTITERKKIIGTD